MRCGTWQESPQKPDVLAVPEVDGVPELQQLPHHHHRRWLPRWHIRCLQGEDQALPKTKDEDHSHQEWQKRRSTWEQIPDHFQPLREGRHRVRHGRRRCVDWETSDEADEHSVSAFWQMVHLFQLCVGKKNYNCWGAFNTNKARCLCNQQLQALRGLGDQCVEDLFAWPVRENPKGVLPGKLDYILLLLVGSVPNVRHSWVGGCWTYKVYSWLALSI